MALGVPTICPPATREMPETNPCFFNVTRWPRVSEQTNSRLNVTPACNYNNTYTHHHHRLNVHSSLHAGVGRLLSFTDQVAAITPVTPPERHFHFQVLTRLAAPRVVAERTHRGILVRILNWPDALP